MRELRERVDSAQGLIEAVRNAALEPNRTKVLRSFPATEICRYLGNISIDTLYRRLKKDSELPQGTQLSARRRVFSLEEIHALQRAFGITPRRPVGQPPLVLSVCNFNDHHSPPGTVSHAEWLPGTAHRP